jgi:hypothetical protein
MPLEVVASMPSVTTRERGLISGDVIEIVYGLDHLANAEG